MENEQRQVEALTGEEVLRQESPVDRPFEEENSAQVERVAQVGDRVRPEERCTDGELKARRCKRLACDRFEQTKTPSRTST